MCSQHTAVVNQSRLFLKTWQNGLQEEVEEPQYDELKAHKMQMVNKIRMIKECDRKDNLIRVFQLPTPEKDPNLLRKHVREMMSMLNFA